MPANVSDQSAFVPIRGIAALVRRPCIRRVYAYAPGAGSFRVSKREALRLLSRARRAGRVAVVVAQEFGADELTFGA